MRKLVLSAIIMIACLPANAGRKDSTIYYNLPDSVKAVQFITEVTIRSYDTRKWFRLRMQTEGPSLEIMGGRRSGSFIFYPKTGPGNITRGMNTRFDLKSFGISFTYQWRVNETYKLLIALATDSAANITIYSGYVFLPREGKWKFIGSGKAEIWRASLLKPSLVCIQGKKQQVHFTNGQTWVQRSSGSWKTLKNDSLPPPAINLFGHLDSMQQRQTDIRLIEDAMASGKTDAKQNEQGVYYLMMKEGTGRPVSVNDTVTIYYKGSLFSDGTIFDQTKDKPASFPLKRLIRGWQLGVPLCKVGGRIKLVIPSDLAYSIRTRAAKIPPNSILVFEIEVLEAKSP